METVHGFLTVGSDTERNRRTIGGRKDFISIRKGFSLLLDFFFFDRMRFRDVSIDPFGGQFVVLIAHSYSSSSVRVSHYSRLGCDMLLEKFVLISKTVRCLSRGGHTIKIHDSTTNDIQQRKYLDP
jgi:hypothetical protein